MVLQELDGSAIIEKYHMIKPTKGVLLLPLGSLGSLECQKLSKPQNIQLVQKCCEFGMKNAIDLALLEQYNMKQAAQKKSLCLELAYFST